MSQEEQIISKIIDNVFSEKMYSAQFIYNVDLLRFILQQKNKEKYDPAIFLRAITDLIKSTKGKSHFSSVDIKQEFNEIKSKLKYKKFIVYFGLVHNDSNKTYLPKKFKANNIQFSKIKFSSYFTKMGAEYQKQYLENFLENESLEKCILTDDIQSKVLQKLYKQTFYKAVLFNDSPQNAIDKVEEIFLKVLLAPIACANLMSDKEMTIFSKFNIIKRKTPVVYNGIFAVHEDKHPQFYFGARNEIILQNNSKDFIKNHSTIHKMKNIAKKDNQTCVEKKIVTISTNLYEALSTNNLDKRHLTLWRCIELFTDSNISEKDTMNILKKYYNNDATWNAIGDYIVQSRNDYVHRGIQIEKDIFDSNDTILNYYHEYIQAEMHILFCMQKNKLGTSEEDYNTFLDCYKQNNENISRVYKNARWLMKHRKYGRI